MSAIFISYRREDSSGYTGRLASDLTQILGADRIFQDIDQIDAGTDFVDAIREALDKCEVVLAVIGPRWLESKDNKGRRRLDNPEDFVVLEIKSALDRKLRVIPVLVGGAQMPNTDELPDMLKLLARRHAHEITDSRWWYDVSQLVDKIRAAPSRREVASLPSTPAADLRLPITRMKRTVVAALIALVVAGVLLYASTQGVHEQVASAPGVLPDNKEQSLGEFESSLGRMKECRGSYDATTWTHCRGTVTSSNGATFAGSFKNGEFEGVGKITYIDGRTYAGEWRKGLYHGHGTFTSPEGWSYVGEYFEDKRSGHGVLTWTNGTSYMGSFKDGQYDGRGINTYPDHTRFEGDYRNGERHGPGIEYRRNGTILRSGNWVKGVFLQEKSGSRSPANKGQ